MGGPKAWKEMQRRQKEFQNGWGEERPQPNSDDEAADEAEKRDFYAYYDVDPETVNEKKAREANKDPEGDGDENDVTCSSMRCCVKLQLTYDRSSQWPRC
jgi:hypothetical protein